MSMKKKGFTRNELVILIAVVVALAAILIPSLVSIVKKTKENAAMQDQINEQLGQITDKIENQDYVSKAEFEAKLAEELAKLNEQLQADSANKGALINGLQDKLNEAVEKLNSMNQALTKEEVEEMITKALENQLTATQVQEIVKEALKDVVSEQEIKDIVKDAIAKLKSEILASQITTKDMEIAINAAISKALEGTGKDIADLKTQIAEIIAKLDQALTKEEIEIIIQKALENFKEEILTKEEIEKIVDEAVKEALEGAEHDIIAIKAQIAEIISKLDKALTKEEVEAIIKEALDNFKKEVLTQEQIEKIVDEAVKKALEGAEQDIADIKAQIAEIIAKLDKALTREEVEEIIKEVLDKYFAEEDPEVGMVLCICHVGHEHYVSVEELEAAESGSTLVLCKTEGCSEPMKEKVEGDEPEQPDQPEQPEKPEVETTHFICWNNYMHNVQGNSKYPNCTYEADLTKGQQIALGTYGNTDHPKCPRCGEMLFEYENPEFVPPVEEEVHYICWNNYMYNVQGNYKYENCGFEADLTQSQIDMLGTYGNTDHPQCPRCGEMLMKYNNPEFVPPVEEPAHYICWNNYMHNVQGNNKYPNCAYEADLTQSDLDFFGKWNDTDYPICPACGEMLMRYEPSAPEKPGEVVLCVCYSGHEHYVSVEELEEAEQGSALVLCKTAGCFEPMKEKEEVETPEQPADPIQKEVASVEELKNALSNPNVNSITLVENITLNEVFIINRDVEIDLNGKTLKTAKTVEYPNASTLTINPNCVVTIKNGKIVDVATNMNSSWNYIYVSANATLNLEDTSVAISITPEVYRNNTMNRWQSNSAEHRIFVISNGGSVVLKDANINIVTPEVTNFSNYTRQPFTMVGVYFSRNSQNAEFIMDGGSFSITSTNKVSTEATDTLYFVKSDRVKDQYAATNKVEIKGNAEVTIGEPHVDGKLNSTNELFYLGTGYYNGKVYYSGIKTYTLSKDAKFNVGGVSYALNTEEDKVWDLEEICQEFGLKKAQKAFYNITEIEYHFVCTDCNHEADFTLSKLEEHTNYWGTKKVNGVVLPKCAYCTYGGLELQK